MLLRVTIARCIGRCLEKCCESDNAAEKRAELATYSVSEDYIAEIKFGPLYEFFKRAEIEHRALMSFKEDELPPHMDDQMIRKIKGKMKKRIEVIKHRFN